MAISLNLGNFAFTLIQKFASEVDLDNLNCKKNKVPVPIACFANKSALCFLQADLSNTIYQLIEED